MGRYDNIADYKFVTRYGSMPDPQHRCIIKTKDGKRRKGRWTSSEASAFADALKWVLHWDTHKSQKD